MQTLPAIFLEADNVKPSNSGKDTFEVGRTFSVFEMLQNQIYDTITNITLLASGLGNDIQTTVQNQTSGLISSGGGCGQVSFQRQNIKFVLKYLLLRLPSNSGTL